MSWSIHAEGHPRDLPKKLQQAVAEHISTNGMWPIEQVDQSDAAIEAATVLLKSKAIATNMTRHRVAVQITGHTNPDHLPRDGYANDTVTVSVSQVAVDTSPEED